MSHILVIDDEETIRAIIRLVLEKDGHKVDEAENGGSGLKLVELHPYDLVITDMIMPDVDGIEVISSLKKNHPQIKTIVITGGSVMNEKEYLMKIGTLMNVNCVLPKPFRPEELLATVKEVLSS
jgi:CheY-like chemotaxis protein